MDTKRKIYYVFDKSIRDATNKIPNIKLRSALVHATIKAYSLLNQCTVSPIIQATEEDLLSFHSSTYVEHLKKAQDCKDLEKVMESEETADFNLEYDCPLFENILDFVKIIAGGTMSAAKLLCNEKPLLTTLQTSEIDIKPKSYLKYKDKRTHKDKSSVYDLPCNLTLDEDSLEASSSPLPKRFKRNVEPEPENKLAPESTQKVALNWYGGWHHAQRDAAEGFCYVNDIVIGIQELLKYYKRVLYIDLDVHHGNGVENAFAYTSRVLTLSIHKHGPGYYPGTGDLEAIGSGQGLYHTVNVPLKDGITDEPYIYIFNEIVEKIREVYQPDCVVMQCGADCLAGDPLGGFNLTLNGVGSCVKSILEWELPTLLLGGGGYNISNAARCYAYLTSIAVGVELSNDIPENDFFHLFGPAFELPIAESLRKDENSKEYLESTLKSVLKNLGKIKPNGNEDACLDR